MYALSATTNQTEVNMITLRTYPCELCGREVNLQYRSELHLITEDGHTWAVCDCCYSNHNEEK